MLRQALGAARSLRASRFASSTPTYEPEPKPENQTLKQCKYCLVLTVCTEQCKVIVCF